MKSKHFLFIFLALSFAACSSFERAEKPIEINLRGLKIPAGTADAEFYNLIAKGNLKKQDITFTYYPEDDALCLEYRHNLTISYYQFWNRSSRIAFINSLEKYKYDYLQRDLTAKKKKQTKRQYATEPSFLAWETSRYSMFGYGWSNYEIGYQFMNNAPYFTITQREAQNEEPVTKSDNYQSETVVLYFTRAQAEDVAAIFNQSYLASLQPPARPVRTPEETASDPYEEGNF